MTFDPKVTLGNVLTVASLLITLVTGYVNLKLDVQASVAQIEQVQAKVTELDKDSLPTRLSVLESTIATSRASRDKQFDQMADKLDRMDASIVALSNALAGLTATLRAQEARR
jgi:hypothetical protein